MAALNAYGIKSSINLPPPPGVLLVTAAGNAGVEMLWLNPAFVNWTFELLWPAVSGIGGIYFASARHTAQWELRNSKGQIKTRGEAVSGGTRPGRRLTWPEQAATDTEAQILATIEGKASPGDILTIRGTKPPCNFCDRAMVWAAKRFGIKILYEDAAGYVSQY